MGRGGWALTWGTCLHSPHGDCIADIFEATSVHSEHSNFLFLALLYRPMLGAFQDKLEDFGQVQDLGIMGRTEISVASHIRALPRKPC